VAFPKKSAPPSSDIGSAENPASAFSSKKKSSGKDNKLSVALKGLKAAK
jgi:hypothetical protein